MKVAIGLILMTGLMLGYFIGLDEKKANSFGWGVYFHASWCYMVAFFIFAFLDRTEGFIKQLSIIAILYSSFLGTAFVLNYYGIMQRTYGLIITSVALLVSTISCIRYGLFRDEN